jgi:hypothetical protein
MTSQTFNFNSTNFTVSQLLFDFGRSLDSIRSAVAVADASRADTDPSSIGTVGLDATTRYKKGGSGE